MIGMGVELSGGLFVRLSVRGRLMGTDYDS